jgi:putative flippase GtrA
LLYAWIDVTLAYALGYVLSFVVNFYLSAYFTFQSAPSWSKLVGMMGAHGVNILLHLALLNLFLWLGLPKAIAPIPVYTVAVPVNFVLVRFVFKAKSQ